MAINTECVVYASFFERWMTVKQLKKILGEIDDNFEVVPNVAGNLLVYDPKENMEVGYIDFHEETYEAY